MSQFRLALLLITVGTCLAATQDFQDKLVSTLLSQIAVGLQLILPVYVKAFAKI